MADIQTRVLGLHHMTAICDNHQQNVDFYAGLLGLRLVKVTVNFDDPTAYHFYFGDGVGSPGTGLTFFPYPEGRQGRIGAGQVVSTSLSIPHDAADFWLDRLRAAGVSVHGPKEVGEERTLSFEAPDGLPLQLVATSGHKPGQPWDGMSVPPERAIGPMRFVSIWSLQPDATRQVLTDVLGMQEVEAQGRVRYSPEGGTDFVDLDAPAEGGYGHGGHGTVHHIAFRVETDADHAAMHLRIQKAGLRVSPIIDRTYFHSIYFREPGGVLFEVATNGPGMTVDEPQEQLGTTLRLPPQYESLRAEIEAALPPIARPAGRTLLR